QDLSGKKICKSELLRMANMKNSLDKPLISMISPLFSRKGVDLLEQSIQTLIEKDCRIILQGTGDRNYIKIFQDLAEKYKGSFAFFLDLNQLFSRQIIAGSDILLSPSRFEPCGLNQIYALRFGTIPIAHKTGGLDDTLIDNDNENSLQQTGFKFTEYSVESLIAAIERALECYRDSHAWTSLIKTAMKQDFSWKRSAEKYVELYQNILSSE
ncbi:glycosyltransferase, partial [bacterium]|nr:glycosyltransferase [bacterium]